MPSSDVVNYNTIHNASIFLHFLSLLAAILYPFYNQWFAMTEEPRRDLFALRDSPPRIKRKYPNEGRKALLSGGASNYVRRMLCETPFTV
jgi:hypothetical protein